MKKIFTILFLMLFCIGCSNQQSMSDAQIFKKEYEELNGTIREKDGKTIRAISISEENPIVISSAEEIVEKIENKDTFIVYFGFPSCPWCRSILPTFLDVAKEKGVQSIYYVDIENIRDTLSLDDQGNVVEELKGSDAYNQLLEAFSDVLDSYILKDEDGNEIDTMEKRIYAPNFIIVKSGKAVYKMEGTSDLQTDGYMDLSEEMIEDMRVACEEFFEIVKGMANACEVDTKC